MAAAHLGRFKEETFSSIESQDKSGDLQTRQEPEADAHRRQNGAQLCLKSVLKTLGPGFSTLSLSFLFCDTEVAENDSSIISQT